MTDLRFDVARLTLAIACTLGATAASAATVAYYTFENGVAGEPPPASEYLSPP